MLIMLTCLAVMTLNTMGKQNTGGLINLFDCIPGTIQLLQQTLFKWTLMWYLPASWIEGEKLPSSIGLLWHNYGCVLCH